MADLVGTIASGTNDRGTNATVKNIKRFIWRQITGTFLRDEIARERFARGMLTRGMFAKGTFARGIFARMTFARRTFVRTKARVISMENGASWLE